MPKRPSSDRPDATSDSNTPALPRPSKKPRLDEASNPNITAIPASSTGRFSKDRAQRRTSRRQPSRKIQQAGESAVTTAEDAITKSRQGRTVPDGAVSPEIARRTSERRQLKRFLDGYEEDGRDEGDRSCRKKRARISIWPSEPPPPCGPYRWWLRPKLPPPPDPRDFYEGPLWTYGLDPAEVEEVLENARKGMQRLRNDQDIYMKYRLAKLHGRLPSPDGEDDDSWIVHEPDADPNGMTPLMFGLENDDGVRLAEVFGEEYARWWIADREAQREARKAAPPPPPRPGDYDSEHDDDNDEGNEDDDSDDAEQQAVKLPPYKSIDSVRAPNKTVKPHATRKPKKEAKKEKVPRKKKETRKKQETRDKVNRTDSDTPASRRLTRQSRSTTANAIFYELDQRGKVRVA